MRGALSARLLPASAPAAQGPISEARVPPAELALLAGIQPEPGAIQTSGDTGFSDAPINGRLFFSNLI